MQFFDRIEKAAFIERPNRYIVHCDLAGRKVKAYLPNPGRLQELLLPCSRLYLTPAADPYRKTRYTAVAVNKGGCPVMLHTHVTNEVAGHLLRTNRVPGLENAKILKREVQCGHSRLDFLLERDGRTIFLEVKSCTLFSAKAGLFPDAVTARGKRHIEELEDLAGRGAQAAVLFVVHHPGVRYFLPDFHTDPDFAQALLAARKKIKVLPVSVTWNKDLSLGKKTRLLEIPWHIVKEEAKDRGCYMAILRRPRAGWVQTGGLGRIRFEKGYYVYVGSAMANLSKRIARHQRLRKKKFWHIDYLRASSEFIAALPIMTGSSLECDLAKAVRKIADHEVKRFGCSDCACASHLFRMKGHPFHDERFHVLLQHFRIDRLL